ncbi:MAG: TIM barrel protein [Clostridia bacterium]|nr:TIM barrel protein [Clostridia bacterium]
MIKFGPAGNSEDFYNKGYKRTIEAPAYLKSMGLDLFEYSFGQGVSLKEETANAIREQAELNEIEISVHAPYYVNFANPDDEMAEKSVSYVINSAKKLRLMGGRRVVFHPASQGKAERKAAVELTKIRMEKLMDAAYKEGLSDMLFCPETMGKLGQIGTVEEITEFCKIDKALCPCVDFGHVNAREQGSLKTEKDYEERLAFMISELGYGKMKDFHVHFSKIEYSSGGEVRHLTFKDDKFGPEFAPLSVTLKKLGLEPYVICESAGTQDKDAAAMRKIYYNN